MPEVLRAPGEGKEHIVDEHSNVGRMRDALTTFNRGDLDGYREFFDDDVVELAVMFGHVPGDGVVVKP